MAVISRDGTSVAPRVLRSMTGAIGVSSFGDGMFSTALPLAAAAATRNPTAVALVIAVGRIPWLVVSPIAGAFVDRLPYRRVVVTADLVRAAAVGALALLIGTGTTSLVALGAVAFCLVSGQVFHDAAMQGGVAALVGRDNRRLDRVNGRIFGLEIGGRGLVGPPVGAASYVAAPWAPFGADAVSFLGSAWLLRRMPRDLRPTAQPVTESVVAAIRAGGRWLMGHRLLRSLTGLTAVTNFAFGMVAATFVLFATDATGLAVGAFGFGLLTACLAAGGVIGGPLTGRVTALVGPVRTVLLANAVQGAAWLVILAVPVPVAAAVALAFVGAALTVITVTCASQVQLHVPQDMVGRIVNTSRTLTNTPGPLGAVVGGLVAAAWGLTAPMVVAPVLLFAATLLVGGVLLRGPAVLDARRDPAGR